jgi:hypothetical protein
MNGATGSWAELDAELARWRALGRVATLWWRDDDAAVPDAALARLAALSARWSVPLSLAVIPARMSSALERVLASAARAHALQHGFAHTDHAAREEPAAELGEHRPAAVVLDELACGQQRLRRELGAAFLPVLVPPWNRIAASLLPCLAPAGFQGLSCFAARTYADAGDGVVLANCHVDPVDWRRGGAFRGEARSLSALIGHLRARRCGAADAHEPSGVLTHHWRHDAELWTFLERLFAHLHARPEVRWLDARSVFAR